MEQMNFSMQHVVRNALELKKVTGYRTYVAVHTT